MNPFLTKHEDLIWAIRQTTEYKQDKRTSDIHPATSMMQFHKDTQLQLLGTLIPDEVLLNVNNFMPLQFNGAILYGTIFGLSKISDIYNEPLKGGPIQFTKVLNEYFGAVIEEILSYEGDILTLSGDSFLALWRSSNGSTPNDEVHIAINSALSIQKHCGKFNAAGVDIRMKMTITAGLLVFSLIGDEKSATYICIGRPIDDLIEAQQKCNEDELIVAPSAWMFVKLLEFNALETEDGAHFKVIGIGPNWHLTRKDYTMKRLSKGYENIAHELLSDEELEYEEMTQNTATSNLRPILRLASGIQRELHKFITVQVLDFLEEDEPLERLIEMRYVVVLYINIVIKKCSLRSTIEIVDRCYKFIDRNARQHKGFILRVTLLNKDIKFVVIFGLRGSTNISECRETLKCAVTCQQNLYSIEYVQAVSIACTSGSSYCGIFGHTWRKKYDVMSAFIHKALQMLLTYPDRITCDRKIFLNSQLEAKNFILMDYKKLEGVVNQGLIYEYNEGLKEESYGSTLQFPLNVHTSCPILGRDYELKVFDEVFLPFMIHFQESRFKNALIIEGYPKQGKSRLLIEFVERATDIQRCELILTKQDFMDIYGCVRKFMEPFMQMESSASEYYKQKILKELLPNSGTDKFICSLNGVFNVNFPITESYQKLTDEQKTQEREKRVQNLCKKCFEKPTLISIDNVDLMDEESWKLLPSMLKSKTFFLVAVFNRQRRQVNRLKAFSKIPEVLRLPLKKIPKMCQAAIACQILGVYAISADLENAIQNHSNGSPGWIENFMVTLLQAKKIFIKAMDFKKIHTSGLVAPPLYMLRKLTASQINRYKILLEEKDEHKFDQWNVFIDSCRDEYTNVEVRNQIHKILCSDTELLVCCITKTFNVSLDVDSEISDEMSILELYDGMSYQEQQMLTCASVLGDLFTRSFLYFMWSPESQFIACKVIQTVFEKGVLCCARGDFSSGGDYILQREYMADPIKDKTIECYCIGMDMDDSCILLPTYASCGYMRFRSSKLRLVIYGLIPDNQRREMHVKAAKYIQKETKRCVSCGTAYFPEKQVCRLDMTPIQRLSGKRAKKKKTSQLEQMNFEELFDYANVRSGGGSGSSRDARQSVLPSLRASSVMKSYVGSLTVSGIVEDYQSPYAKIPGIITPFTIYRLKDCVSLVRTFSKSNFVSCECHLILGHMHKRLKYHYREAGFTGDPFTQCTQITKQPEPAPEDPCVRSPCGPNSQCRNVNNQPVCSCLPDYIGSPPNCRPECVVSSECLEDRACINNKCADPCPNTCGIGAQCTTKYHNPICACPPGFSGDPFTRCSPQPVIEEPTERPPSCHPSPCGPNSQCRMVGESPSCSCLPDYIGMPPNCRPECVLSSECGSQLACIKQKCRDPCPGSCGVNAKCSIVTHTPICTCEEGYEGDPFTLCSMKPPVTPPSIPEDPCNPSPCGPNAQCHNGICTCIENYQGNPYESCRPECVLSAECTRDKACIRNRCVDPCSGVCGQNAKCDVINHIPTCSCGRCVEMWKKSSILF